MRATRDVDVVKGGEWCRAGARGRDEGGLLWRKQKERAWEEQKMYRCRGAKMQMFRSESRIKQKQKKEGRALRYDVLEIGRAHV